MNPDNLVLLYFFVCHANGNGKTSLSNKCDAIIAIN